LEKADQPCAPSNDDRAEIGNHIEHAGNDAPNRRVLQANPEKREPGCHTHQNADEYLHQQITLNLGGDFVQYMEGDFFLAEGGTADPDQRRKMSPETSRK
jgi:hypothetical protein